MDGRHKKYIPLNLLRDNNHDYEPMRRLEFAFLDLIKELICNKVLVLITLLYVWVM